MLSHAGDRGLAIQFQTNFETLTPITQVTDSAMAWPSPQRGTGYTP
jgi:hypothetical protein